MATVIGALHNVVVAESLAVFIIVLRSVVKTMRTCTTIACIN